MSSSQIAVTGTSLDISAVQAALKTDGLDGWLLYDFRGINPLAADVTAVNRQGGHLATRRWYYLIPAIGEAANNGRSARSIGMSTKVNVLID